MAVDLSWLWDDRTRSDVTLVVYPAGDGPDGSWTSDQQPEPLETLHLHSIALGSVSPSHFRGKLHRWTSEQQTQAARPPGTEGTATEEPSAKRQCTRPTSNKAHTDAPPASPAPPSPLTTATAPASHPSLHLTCYPEEPVTVPEAVLRHAYTGQLPDDPTTLIWMCWRADYLDIRVTVDACLARLQQMSDSKQLPLSDFMLFTNIPPLQTATAHDLVAVITNSQLLQHFGDTHQIVTAPQLLQQFSQLPFSTLMQWGKLRDQLTTDHHNTFVLLCTAWFDSQQPPPTQEQTKQLSGLIQLEQLTVGFQATVLSRLRWYEQVTQVKYDEVVLHALRSMLADDHLRPQSKKPHAAPHKHTLLFTRAQVAEIWRAGPNPWRHPQSVYYAGIQVHFGVALQAAADNASGTLCLLTWVDWPDILKAHGLDQQVAHPVTGLVWGFSHVSGLWTEACDGASIVGCAPSEGRTGVIEDVVVTDEQGLYEALREGIMARFKCPT